ncbi:MAG: hypothetical protein IJL74_02780 [Bacilli bacterium]|nr:hypothetical protein [Bacilli bacterium]
MRINPKLINQMLVVSDETVCSSLSLTASTNTNATNVSITKSGYKPLGIMGYSMTGTNHQYTNIVILNLTASNNGGGTIQYRFRNLATSATAIITLTAKVLWLKI